MFGYYLSRTGLAKHPYYIGLLGIGLWSVEELCYFLYHNVALIDGTIVNRALTRWLTEEFHLSTTALAMEHNMKLDAPVEDVLLPLWRDTGYLRQHEIRLFTKKMQAMASGGTALRLRMKADALVQNRKYGEAVSVYLQAEENTRKGNAAFLASTLHNHGVALMQLLSYEEAYRVFRRALALEDTAERRQTCLLAAGLAKPEGKFYEEAEEIGADRGSLAEAKGRLDALAALPTAPPVDAMRELQRVRSAYYYEAGV